MLKDEVSDLCLVIVIDLAPMRFIKVNVVSHYLPIDHECTVLKFYQQVRLPDPFLRRNSQFTLHYAV